MHSVSPRGADPVPLELRQSVDTITITCSQAFSNISSRSSDSVSSGVSLISVPLVNNSAGRCFVSDTLFKTRSDQFAPVQQLVENSVVLAASGRELRVASVIRHPPEDCKLVELRAGSANLIITATHRVIGLRREGVPVLAGGLRPGDSIFCSSGGQRKSEKKLEGVWHFSQVVETFEVVFVPDEDLETFLPPSETILTRGSPPPQRGETIGDRPLAHRGRRGGMCMRGRSWKERQENEDRGSIPDTHDSWL